MKRKKGPWTQSGSCVLLTSGLHIQSHATHRIADFFSFSRQDQVPTPEDVSLFANDVVFFFDQLENLVEEFGEDSSKSSIAFDMLSNSFVFFRTSEVLDIAVYDTFVLRLSLASPTDLALLFNSFQLDVDLDGTAEDSGSVLSLDAFITDTTDNIVTIQIPMAGVVQSAVNIFLLANFQVAYIRKGLVACRLDSLVITAAFQS